MTTSRPWYGRILTAAWAAVLGIFIGLFGQGVWSALIAANLMTTPAIPWAVGVMAVVLWIIWQYLGGKWWPHSTSASRRERLRANPLPANVFAWAVIAGALSIVAQAGWWMLISRFENVSASILPDMSEYPWLTTTLAVLALTNAASAFAPDYVSLLIIRLVMLAVGALYTPQAAGTAALIVPAEKRGSTIAFIFLGWSLAAAMVTLSAADPLNLVGILVPGERVPAISGRTVSYQDGIAVSGSEPVLTSQGAVSQAVQSA